MHSNAYCRSSTEHDASESLPFDLRLLTPAARTSKFDDPGYNPCYSAAAIAAMLPGQSDYIFNKAQFSVDGSEVRLAEFFSSIIVDKDELSLDNFIRTKDNISHLDANIGLPVPLFMSKNSRAAEFFFCGCYRIMRWEYCHPPIEGWASSTEAQELDGSVGAHSHSGLQAQQERSPTTWAKVQLEKVVDPILSGQLEHVYVLRYACAIVQSRIAHARSKQ